MDRPIQPVLMVAGCAVLLVAAISLPVAILQPAGHVELVSVRQTPIIEIPVRPPPPAEVPVIDAPVAQAPVTQAPAVEAPVAETPVAKAPLVEGPIAKAPVAEAPIAQAPATKPATRSRRAKASAPEKAPAPTEIAEGDGLSRGQRFRIVEQETIKELGPGAALSSSLARVFAFPTMRSDAVFGIDVSHHTTDNCGCPIDWDRIADQKVAFVYAKATEGVSYKDPTFGKFWSEMGKRPKIHRGAYHFLRADVDVETQVKKFLDTMGTLQPGDLPPAMDLEWDTFRDSTRTSPPRDGSDYWSNLEPDEIIARALKWLQLVERETGRVPVIYTSRAWWIQRVKDEGELERLKRYPIWLSAMEDEDLRLEKPGAKGRWAGKWKWTLWQFTNMGDLTKGGIPNPKKSSDERMDVSIFPGDLGQFQQAVGISASIVVADNKVPATQKADTGGTVTPAEPQKEPAKDTQVAENPAQGSNVTKPAESNVSEAPATGGSTVTPAEPQKDPPKENQVAENPATDGNAVKPAESNASNVFANPTTGGGVIVPVEPAEPQKDQPKENQVADAPVVDSNTSKPIEPNDSNVAANPSTGGGAVAPIEPVEPQKDPPKENQVAVAPEADSNTSKPSESNPSAVVANPATGGGTAMPTEPQKEPAKDTQIAETPAADSSANKPNETNQSNVVVKPETGGGAVTPTEPQKEPPTETQVASLPEADKPVASNPGTGAPNDARVPSNPPPPSVGDSGNNAGSKPSPLGELSDKPTIEIVLKNGRVLRVEENIDPAVLTRLIALLEK